MDDTKSKLIRAALAAVRENGIGAASARTIAARAQVNQALVFYHFGTVNELLEAASNTAVAEAVDAYRSEFEAANSVADLLEIATTLREHEGRNGNVALMAQLMAGAQHDQVLARAVRHALSLWSAEVAGVLRRVLTGNPVAQAVDLDGLAQAIVAGFVGLEMLDGVQEAGGDAAFRALADLGRLVDAVGTLGPVSKKVARAALSRR